MPAAKVDNLPNVQRKKKKKIAAIIRGCTVAELSKFAVWLLRGAAALGQLVLGLLCHPFGPLSGTPQNAIFSSGREIARQFSPQTSYISQNFF